MSRSSATSRGFITSSRVRPRGSGRPPFADALIARGPCKVAAAFEPRLECAGRAVDVVVFDPADEVACCVLPHARLSGPLPRGGFSCSCLVEFAAGLRTPAGGAGLEVPAAPGSFGLVALRGDAGGLSVAELFAGGDVELQPALADVDADHDAPSAIADAEADVVLAHQDVVADGEAARAELELVGAEGARNPHPLAGPGVEVGRVDPAERDHHGRGRVSGGPPVGGEVLAGGVFVGLDHEAVVGAVGSNRLLPTAGAQMLDGLALPGVPLAAILGQLDGEPTAGECAERAAGFDRGELAVVAHQDELAVSRLDVVKHRHDLPRAGHAGLVDDEDDPERQPLTSFEARDRLTDGIAVSDSSCWAAWRATAAPRTGKPDRAHAS
jgi:hypothetical protein